MIKNKQQKKKDLFIYVASSHITSLFQNSSFVCKKKKKKLKLFNFLCHFLVKRALKKTAT